MHLILLCRNNRGYTKNQLGLFDEALSDLNESILLDPNTPNPYAHRAYSYLKLNDNLNAESDIKRSINLDSEYGYAHYVLGLIEQSKGKINEACISWNNALKLGIEEAQEKLDEFCPDQSSKTPNV